MSERVAALDGLRGWASLSVVIFHLTYETFGVIFPAFRALPLAILAQGSLPVCIFMALSGYVLSAGMWAGGSWRGPAARLARRYPRLAIPVLAVVLLTYGLFALGWTAAAPDAFAVVHREDWMGYWLLNSPTLDGAIRFALLDVFLGARDYGLFLWTMLPELWGSIGLLLLAGIVRQRALQAALLIALTVLLLIASEPYFAAMTLGGLIAWLHDQGWLPRAHRLLRLGAVAAAIAIGAALELGALPSFIPVVLAGTIIVAMVAIGPTPMLEGPVSQWLGRLSFPLYLVQFPVIISATAWLIRLADRAGSLTPWTAAGIALLSTIACLLAALAFLPIEEATLRLCRRIARTRRAS